MKLVNELIQLEELDSALKHFGTRLRAARIAQDLTQAELGDLIGRAANTVAMIERGEQAPGFDAMEAIFAKLGQPPAYYFSEMPPVAKRKPTPKETLEVVREALEKASLPPEVASRLVRLQRLVADNNVEALVAIDQIMDKFDRVALAKPSGHGKKPEGGVL